jgi:hypothetical protein
MTSYQQSRFIYNIGGIWDGGCINKKYVKTQDDQNHRCVLAYGSRSTIDPTKEIGQEDCKKYYRKGYCKSNYPETVLRSCWLKDPTDPTRNHDCDITAFNRGKLYIDENIGDPNKKEIIPEYCTKTDTRQQCIAKQIINYDFVDKKDTRNSKYWKYADSTPYLKTFMSDIHERHCNMPNNWQNQTCKDYCFDQIKTDQNGCKDSTIEYCNKYPELLRTKRCQKLKDTNLHEIDDMLNNEYQEIFSRCDNMTDHNQKIKCIKEGLDSPYCKSTYRRAETLPESIRDLYDHVWSLYCMENTDKYECSCYLTDEKLRQKYGYIPECSAACRSGIEIDGKIPYQTKQIQQNIKNVPCKQCITMINVSAKIAILEDIKIIQNCFNSKDIDQDQYKIALRVPIKKALGDILTDYQRGATLLNMKIPDILSPEIDVDREKEYSQKIKEIPSQLKSLLTSMETKLVYVMSVKFQSTSEDQTLKNWTSSLSDLSDLHDQTPTIQDWISDIIKKIDDEGGGELEKLRNSTYLRIQQFRNKILTDEQLQIFNNMLKTYVGADVHLQNCDIPTLNKINEILSSLEDDPDPEKKTDTIYEIAIIILLIVLILYIILKIIN